LKAHPFPIEHHFLPSKNKSVALNHGLRYCSDGLILLADDDVRIHRRWVTAYLEAAADHPESTVFGGTVDVEYEVEPSPALLPYMTGSTKPSPNADTDGWVSPSHRFLGCNWAAWRRDLLAIDGFDARFGPGAKTGATGQESDAQRRLRRLGCRGRFVASAWVTNFVEAEQVTSDWIVSRRRRAGREIGLVIGDTVPAPFRAAAVRSAVAWLRFKFERSKPRCREPADFHDRWWRSYLEGAFDSVRDYLPRDRTGVG
ncbi:MAG: glycosyltransferase, partial [Planctomycetota bacterium]